MRRRGGGGVQAPAPERFAKFVRAQPNGCRLWIGALNSKGYPCFAFGGKGKTVLAHRWSYEHLRGPIPRGLTLDHLCQWKTCVNAWHLEPVSDRENKRRAVERRRAARAA
jgi:hypothetical protein